MKKMGFISVYNSLKELFPQVDARLLKAVAIEHSKDLNGAVEAFVTEVLPFISDKADVATPAVKVNGEMTETPSSSSVAGSLSGKDDNDSDLLNDANNDSDSLASSFYDANDTEDLQNPNTRCDATIAEISQGEKLSISSGSLISEDSKNDCIQAYVEHEDQARVLSRDLEDQITDVNGNNTDGVLLAVSEQREDDVGVSNHLIVNEDGFEDDPIFDDHQEQKSLDNLWGCSSFADGVSMSVSEPVLENRLLFSDADFTEMSSYVDTNLNMEPPVSDGGVTESGTALSTIVTRSGQTCKIKLLEDIIQDAKSYQDTLLTATDSVLRLIEDVEYHEKEAEQAKAAIAKGGLDILQKVEEIKKMLKHAKEANEMHAGEVYGEKSILATEVRELQNRLFGLADEKDRSLAILVEMQKTLEERLIAAEEERKAAERVTLEKQQIARGALAEQEQIMEKVVQESKLLQQEAEENAKLRDFLMEKGHVVDELQGEISVICQDVKSLKEKFDNRVALSKSVSIEQTSFRLASSTSSVKSNASNPATSVLELPETSRTMIIPAPSVENQTPRSNVGEDAGGSGRQTPRSNVSEDAVNSGATDKDLLDEDWELFEY